MKAAIVGIAGPELTADEAALFREHRPAGVILFARNIVDPAQLRRLTAQIGRALPPSGGDHGGPGGRPGRPAAPAALAAASRRGRDRRAVRPRRARRLARRLADRGADRAGCAAAGIEVVCAPVLDLRRAGADAVIGDRAYAADPDAVGELAAALAAGLLAAGVQPVGKHAPGHGRATLDSHLALPTLRRRSDADLVPFAAAPICRG